MPDADISLLDAAVTFSVEEADDIDAIVSGYESRIKTLTEAEHLVNLAVEADDLAGAQSILSDLEASAAAAGGEVERLAVGFSDAALAVNRLDEIDATLRKAAGGADALADELKEVAAEFGHVQASSASTNFNIPGLGTTSAGMNRLGSSTARVNNLLFDTVNLVDDAQYGFRAISNNIPQVTRSFGFLVSESGSVNAALGKIGGTIGGFVAAIPGLAAAAGVVGGGALVAGVAASVGRLDELVSALGRVAGTARDAFGSVIDSMAPVGDAIRGYLIDPIIQLVNTVNSDLREALNLEINIEGRESVEAARAEIEELRGAAESISPAAAALEADMEKIRQGIGDGTNDTRQAREELRAFEKVLDELSAANATAEINEVVKSLEGIDQTPLLVDLGDSLDRMSELQAIVEDGGKASLDASVKVKNLADELKRVGELEAGQTLEDIAEQSDLLTDSSRAQKIEEFRETLESLNQLQVSTGFAVDLSQEIGLLETRIAEFDSNQDFLKGQAESIKNAAKETDELQKRIEQLKDSTKDYRDEVDDVAGALAAGLKNVDVELDFSTALNILESEIDRILNQEFGDIQQLQSQRVSGINAQAGTDAERTALLGIEDAQRKTNEQQRLLQERARARNELMREGNSVLRDIRDHIRPQGSTDAGISIVEVQKVNL